MSESAEDIRKRIKSGELDTVPTPTPPKKRSLLSRILTYPLEAIQILLGIDKDSLDKPAGPKIAPPPERPSVRDTYRVDPPPPPSIYNLDPVAWANVRGYLGQIDGKGDPEPHNCGHEHDK